ncbi:RmlC-like cupin domain-containing protein [Halteromyces radiatus]|uniref:RmlC-like cupin domain-containing protein n=1 Tax=Halteromyces radiatus TaxID=101107 RepID=UPI00221E62E0|nr:RmlC-like cupin domain-containing protein [Halteromyces radiatus]KAI8093499.1 RmlC-like cupin domain-containing protein [Halteromyces radiatus]
MASVTRSIVKSVLSREQMDGVGARVYRSIGTQALRNLDPFLMLDEFDVEPPAGFPLHPHRGFETVTYLLDGKFQHEDFKGHRGLLTPGCLQWMTAGRGIVHAELPVKGQTERAHGLQLWVNLASKDKMIEPSYQEFPADKVVSVSPTPGLDIKVIAGESYGTKSPVFTRTPTMFIDVKMAKKGLTMEQSIPADFRGFIYTLEGKASFGGSKHVADAHHTLVLSDEGTTIPVEALSDNCHFVIIAGRPLNEPIVQYGPFVMNTKEEIYQAFADYERGQNGFEGANEFVSEIEKDWKN